MAISKKRKVQPTTRNQPNNRPRKYCRCKPTCNKLLSKKARRTHRKQLTPQEIPFSRDSLSPDPFLEPSNSPPAAGTAANRRRSQTPAYSPPLPSLSSPPRDFRTDTYEDHVMESAKGTGPGSDLEDRASDHPPEAAPSADSWRSGSPLPVYFSPLRTSPRECGDRTMESPKDLGLDSDEEDGATDYASQAEGDGDEDETDPLDATNSDDDQGDDWPAFDEDGELEAVMENEEILAELDKMLTKEFEGEDFETRQEYLSEADHDCIRAFKVCMVAKMPRRAFDQMRFAFSHKLEISSHYVVVHRLAILSRIVPQWFDCCVNSCIAYTGEYEEHELCPLCSEARRSGRFNRARRMFCYIPAIPRLQNLFSNPHSLQELQYRQNYKYDATTISDVFDSEHYRTLLEKKVTVDGHSLSHNYFSDPRDIALSICLDGYLLYKRRRGGPSATPILLQIYNLPPEIRTHISRLICLGVIPGPKGPKRLDAFLAPFDEELVLLARGVKTHDCVEKERFDLHSYLLFPLGDIIAIEKFLNVKGHNGKCPCRSCKIHAVNNPDSPDKTYYVPLTYSTSSDTLTKRDPHELLLRSHGDWVTVSEKIAVAKTAKRRNEIAMLHGIKGMPALQRVGSLDYARGVPWDYMHLLLENVVKNLVHLWMGRFKGLDEGTEDYIIPDHIWKEIGQETVAATKHIPADFVRSLGNLAEDQSTMTAESWSFWFIYLAPILLKNRFQKAKYYNHLCDLVAIMKTCLQFSITRDEIDRLEEDIIQWVEEYEKIYYQYDPERLSTCILTIHGLLHVCDNIRFCGPVWTTWTFWMERYCGYLQGGLRSKVNPWANLNNRILHKAYLDQVDIHYGLKSDLEITAQTLTAREQLVDGYPHSILRPPCKKQFEPDAALKSKITRYFSEVIHKPAARITPKLPKIMPSWGKVRIANGGDRIRTESASHTPERERNMSYVRYEVEVLDADGDWIREIFYGKLERVLQCELPTNPFWKDLSGKTVLLAVITPSQTHGRDATKELTGYGQTTTAIVTDLRTVSCVVGRVESRNKWWIVDRSGDFSRTEFIPSQIKEFSLSEDEDE